jgi:hypothetical protein
MVEESLKKEIMQIASLPTILPGNFQDGIGTLTPPLIFALFREIVIDSKNVVHLVYTAENGIRYRNTRSETRTSNTFSSPIRVSHLDV